MFHLLSVILPGGGRCEKRKFDTRAEAQQFASKVRKGRGGGKQRPYLCNHPSCVDAGFWHLTKQSSDHVAYYRNQDRKKGRK